MKPNELEKGHEDTQKPDLSQIPRLRPVEEIEQEAYPGMTASERRREQRARDGFEYTDEEVEDIADRNVVIGAAVMPGESTITSAPTAGAAPGPVIITTLDKDDLDDKVDERRLR